ncbi:MAG: type II secretion system protein J [Bacteroidia bacterium]
MKIRAFTLIEVIVAMILSGIVVAFAAVAFQLVSKQFMSFKKSGERINELFVFQHQLQKDVRESELILHEALGLKFIFDDNKQATYLVYEENIIRDNGTRTDTFFVSNAEVESILIPYSNIPGAEIINYISMEFKVDKDTVYAEFNKDYPVATLLKYELRNTIE